MRTFSKGRRVRVLVQLAAAVVVALVMFYALAILGVPEVVLALGFAAVLLFSLTWMYVRMRRQKDEYMRHHALYDSLIDLPCRALFADRVDAALNRVDGGSTAVMFVDLDDFKEINHSLGYAVGDKLLTCIAERLDESFRPGGTIARLGGDEFTVLLENVTGKGSVIAVGERIGAALGAPFKLKGSEVLVSASVGIAMSDDSDRDNTSENLLREANVAMGAAKKKGKSRYRMFDPGAQTTTGGRLLQEAEVRRLSKRRSSGSITNRWSRSTPAGYTG